MKAKKPSSPFCLNFFKTSLISVRFRISPTEILTAVSQQILQQFSQKQIIRYLTGVFDDILKENSDMQLDAILETSRGCPRNCAYCDWGCTNSKVKFFSLERVYAEIEWFAKNKIAYFWGADSNFGTHARDEEIADYIVEMRKKFGYPERIQINYAKDNPERVFRINQKFEKYGLSKLGSTISFQSLNPDTLAAIGRKNVSLEKFGDLMSMYRNAGVSTYSELILGLPCETYQSFCRGIGTLLEAGQHRDIFVYNCVILPNSPIDYLDKYGIKTAEVVLFTAHNKVETEIAEKTKCVVGTSSMNSEEWIAVNIFACFEKSLHHFGILQKFAIYFHYEKNVRYEDFYNSVINWCRNSDNEIINRPYRFLYDFYKKFSLEQPMELYRNEEIYGKVNWAPDHTVHMDSIFRLEDYYRAIRPLLESYESDKTILDEITEYQKCVLKRANRNNYSCDFTYGWHEYFTKAIAGEYVPLKQYSNRVNINNEKNPENWPEYAFESVWFGKNGGPFNTGITNELL